MAFLVVLITALAAAVTATSHRVVSRQVSELRDNYDFVIAGGGTCGLTVADRLSEAFPDSMLAWPFRILLASCSEQLDSFRCRNGPRRRVWRDRVRPRDVRPSGDRLGGDH